MEQVIFGSLLWVGESFISRSDFFEFFFSLGIALVAIRVCLESFRSVSGFDLFLGGRWFYALDGIKMVVFFHI